jgi:mannitol-1-/sugar-/sorbitol-6-phosphatase
MNHKLTHLLFDVDGVLLDSEVCYRHVWRTWATMRDLDPVTVVSSSHGCRSRDTIRRVAPYLDPQEECAVLDTIMERQADEIQPFPEVKSLLESLKIGTWAIVTSGDESTVRQCFRQHGLPLPSVQVYGESVARAKPAPDAYRLAAEKLGVSPEHCLVIEDSPSGVAAGKEANCTVAAISTSVSPSQLSAADFCFPSLRKAASFIRSIGQEKDQPLKR